MAYWWRIDGVFWTCVLKKRGQVFTRVGLLVELYSVPMSCVSNDVLWYSCIQLVNTILTWPLPTGYKTQENKWKNVTPRHNWPRSHKQENCPTCGRGHFEVNGQKEEEREKHKCMWVILRWPRLNNFLYPTKCLKIRINAYIDYKHSIISCTLNG